MKRHPPPQRAAANRPSRIEGSFFLLALSLLRSNNFRFADILPVLAASTYIEVFVPSHLRNPRSCYKRADKLLELRSC